MINNSEISYKISLYKCDRCKVKNAIFSCETCKPFHNFCIRCYKTIHYNRGVTHKTKQIGLTAPHFSNLTSSLNKSSDAPALNPPNDFQFQSSNSNLRSVRNFGNKRNFNLSGDLIKTDEANKYYATYEADGSAGENVYGSNIKKLNCYFNNAHNEMNERYNLAKNNYNLGYLSKICQTEPSCNDENINVLNYMNDISTESNIIEFRPDNKVHGSKINSLINSYKSLDNGIVRRNRRQSQTEINDAYKTTEDIGVYYSKKDDKLYSKRFITEMNLLYEEEKNVLKFKIDNLEREISKVKNSFKSEINSFQEKERKQNEKFAWMERLYNSKIEEIDRKSREKVLFLVKENEELHEKIKAVKEENKRLKTDSASYKQNIASLSKQNESAIKKYKKLLEDKEREIVFLQENSRRNSEQIFNDCKAENDKLKDKICSCEETTEILRGKNIRMKDIIEKMKEDNSNLIDLNNFLSKDNSNLKAKVSEYNTITNKLLNDLEYCKEINERLLKSIDFYENVFSKLKSEINTLKSSELSLQNDENGINVLKQRIKDCRSDLNNE